MSTKTVRIPVNNANIPLIYEHVGRSTIVNEDVAARLPSFFGGDQINADFGTPDIIFAENVLPYAKGIYSVGFAQQTAAAPGPITTADQYIPLRDIDENIRGYIPAAGGNYIYNATTNTWTSVNSFTFTGSLVTRAYVNGRTFVCFERNRILEYNVGTGLFTSVALTYPAGLSIANVRGIGAASNYLLFFTEFAIYWCSPLDILDFSDPDQGSGNQTPVDIKGQITAILNVSGGFIVYSARNAIGATFTNNAAAPFVFKEINNAGGVASWERVTPEADETGHYIWGTNGLQLVGLNKAINVFPEVTDFLVGGQIESWNPTTKQVEVSTVGSAFSVKLAFLAGRFLCISYGAGSTQFSHALIYDTALKRWGKLKIDHVDAFMFAYVAGTGAYTYDTLPGTYDSIPGDYASLGLFFLAVTAPKQGMAFMKQDGSIYVLVSNFVHDDDDSVVIFGRVQQRHGDKVTLQAFELEAVKSLPAPTVTVLGSVSGYNRDSASVMILNEAHGNSKLYNKRVTATNLDLAVEGTFVISSALVQVSRNGSR